MIKYTASAQDANAEALALSESFILPVVASLETLARGDAAYCRVSQTTRAGREHRIERRVGLAFELLGFDIERMG